MGQMEMPRSQQGRGQLLYLKPFGLALSHDRLWKWSRQAVSVAYPAIELLVPVVVSSGDPESAVEERLAHPMSQTPFATGTVLSITLRMTFRLNVYRYRRGGNRPSFLRLSGLIGVYIPVGPRT